MKLFWGWDFPWNEIKKVLLHRFIWLLSLSNNCYQFTELFISINNFKRVNSSVLCLMRFILTIDFDNSKNCLQVTPNTAITIAFLLVRYKRLPTYLKYCVLVRVQMVRGDDKTDFVLVKIWRRFGIRSSRMTIKKSFWYGEVYV